MLGEKLKELRKSKGLSLQKVADAIGSSKSYIFEIEKGQNQPSYKKMVQISEFFNVNLSYFCNEPKNPKGVNYLLQFFEYRHLPEFLQSVSKPFFELAKKIDSDLPNNPEKTTALRKLLESKDCAVRALLFKAK